MIIIYFEFLKMLRQYPLRVYIYTSTFDFSSVCPFYLKVEGKAWEGTNPRGRREDLLKLSLRHPRPLTRKLQDDKRYQI